MQYSDGYKENTYLTWKGEKYRVTPEFESLSFYDERDGDVSLYCISLTDDWHKEELYPCWDAFCGIDGPLSESLVEQWICDYESQSGGLEYGDGRFEHYGWNSQDISVLDILIERLNEFTATMLKAPACTFTDPRYYGGLRGKVGDVTFDIDWLYRNPKGLKDLQEMEYGDFGEFVSIDDNDLKKALSLERDEDGNIYDPLAKDLDNDGVPDRYDNDFRDSDYFETTYDVEDNIHTRVESKEKVSENPSILGHIKSYQSEEKQTEARENKSKEHHEC